MTSKKFDPIKNKSAEIIEFIMTSPEIPDDPAAEFKIRLSVEEVVENVVSYAYADGAGCLEACVDRVSSSVDGVLLTITLTDQGVPFNPLEQEDPDVTLSAEDRNIGGLGIFLCKQMMDDVSYRYENNSNILTMVKRLA